MNLTSGTQTTTAQITVNAAAPTFTSATPNAGSTLGGTSVTLAGANFVTGATVTMGGTLATNVVVASGGASLALTSPPHAAGPVAIVITNPDARTVTLASGYTYAAPAPTVTSVSPNTATTAGGVSVTITGTGFTAVPTVTIGGTPATGVAFSSSTSIIATAPAHANGVVSVVVTNPDNQTGTLTNGFTYATPAPTVTGITPNSGGTVGGTTVFISGTNFAAGSAVSFGGVPAAGVVVTSPTSITANTPPRAAGVVNVTVTNADFQTGTLTNGFTFIAPPSPPSVTSVSPNSGSTAGGTVVTITGANFVAGASVSFGGTPATSATVTSATSISVVTPARLAGAVTVTVQNPDFQSGSLANAFTFVAPPSAPAVTSVSPNTGGTSGGTTVTIFGSNFVAGATVLFGGTPANGVAVLSPTSITAVTPAKSAGAADVRVTNPDFQFGTLTNGFTYVAPSTTPVISSVSPNTGGTSGGTLVTISGVNFANGATVTFGGTAATGVVVNSSSSITATTPAKPAGAVTVTVTNPTSEFGSLSNGFTYTAPLILEKTNWVFDLTYLGGSFSIDALVIQTGSSLSGTSRDNNQERDVFVSGSVAGSFLTVQIVMANGGSTRGSFTCTGTLAGSPQRISAPPGGNGAFTSVQGTLIGGSTNNLSGSCVMR